MVFYVMVGLIGVVYIGKDKVVSLLIWVIVGVFVVIVVWIGFGGVGVNVVFEGLFVDDNFLCFVKVVILLLVVVVFVLSEDFFGCCGML